MRIHRLAEHAVVLLEGRKHLLLSDVVGLAGWQCSRPVSIPGSEIYLLVERKMMDLKAAGEGRENISTPQDMMVLLEGLFRGKVLSKEMTDDFFKMLSTPKSSFIPRDLPEGLKIANKPGELEGVRNDSGVVFLANRPYIICVMTTYLRRERDGEEAIGKISVAAYRMFDRLARATEYGRVISPGNSSR